MYTVNESLLFLKLKSHFNLVLLKFKRHPCQEIITIYNLLLLCIFFYNRPKPHADAATLKSGRRLSLIGERLQQEVSHSSSSENCDD